MLVDLVFFWLATPTLLWTTSSWNWRSLRSASFDWVVLKKCTMTSCPSQRSHVAPVACRH